MAKAICEDAAPGESNPTLEVFRKQYFRRDTIKREFFKPSDTRSVCPGKGTANDYDLEANRKRHAGGGLVLP